MKKRKLRLLKQYDADLHLLGQSPDNEQAIFLTISRLSIFVGLFLLIYGSLLSINLNAQEQLCACKEYIYLNDLQGDAVHKFEISEGTIALSEIGSPWLDGAVVGGFESPHGLGSDLNGYLYIGETSAGPVRKITCEGEVLPISEFVIADDGGTNISSIGNNLYIAGGSGSNEIRVYDTCTGESTGFVCFTDSDLAANDWGFWRDPRTKEMYYTTRGSIFAGHTWGLYRFTETDINSTCVDPLIVNTTLGDPVEVGENQLDAILIPLGITTDEDGNIYLVTTEDFGLPNTRIVKYNSNGEFIGSSIYDNDNEDGTVGKFSHGVSIVYSETSGLLYTSNGTNAVEEDCISVFDTDLNYIGTGFANTAGTVGDQLAKGIAINKECCPTPTTQIINQVYCAVNSSDPVFLNEEFPCDGIICGASWVPSDAASMAIYDECSQSIMGNLSPGCYNFTKSSDGTGINAQCGAFELNFNLEILQSPEIMMSADQFICEGALPAELSVTTTGTGFQWQMSTTSCTEGFTDIAGATAATYIPNAIAETTYYRVVVTEMAGCSDGSCATESECITVATEFCCPISRCTDIVITQ